MFALLLVAAGIVMVGVLARRRTAGGIDASPRAEQELEADAWSRAWAARVPMLQLVDRATGKPRPRPRPALRGAATLSARWNAALARYDTVMSEWGAIASDPLSALEHSALLDVTQPRTAAFVEALGRAQDRRAVLGPDLPTDRADVIEFEELARRVADT
jgi:hypothetical protein